MNRTFINVAIASCFALGALALVSCKDRQEHESTMDKQPSTSETSSGGPQVSEAVSGVSGTASGAAATSN